MSQQVLVSYFPWELIQKKEADHYHIMTPCRSLAHQAIHVYILRFVTLLIPYSFHRHLSGVSHLLVWNAKLQYVCFYAYKGDHVQTDEQIDAWIRQNADTVYHPSCTCKMGSEDDPMAVVNNKTEVFGVENLRIVDASIMPSVVSGNINGPAIMIAEKAADIILGNPPLSKSKAPVYKKPE